MKPKHALTTAAIVLLAVGLFYLNRGGHAPSGQAPLLSVTPQNFAEVAKVFNASTNDVRVLMLLSPT